MARKRIGRNKIVRFDNNGARTEKGTQILKQFRVFFNLTEREYFGGRLDQADEGNPPSKLAVVSDSAEVEILHMEESHLGFFPQDI